MKPLIPYLMFNGNCREAMKFYQQCFGGELELMTFADVPDPDLCKGANKDEIMHSFLKKDDLTLMASDWPSGEAQQGNNVHLNIDCVSLEEIERLFKALSQNGKVVEPLADAFWGARFGMLVDQYGIHWMLNFQLKD